MYQVIEMYGDYEPWWFLEDWEKDIVTSQSFDDYYEALKYYKRQWLLLREQSPLFKSRSDLMTIFWDPEDQRWCEECDDDLQQYKGLALLKNHQPITLESRKEFYETTNSSGKTKRCERPKQGAWC